MPLSRPLGLPLQLTINGKWEGPHVFVVRLRDDAGNFMPGGAGTARLLGELRVAASEAVTAGAGGCLARLLA